MPSQYLNESFIKSGLICPAGKHQIEFTSSEKNGLYVSVTSASPGQGTYWFRYKDESGKTARVKIGRTTDISVKDAKAKVKTLRAKIQLGSDPAAEKRERKQVIILNRFFEDHYLPHVKKRLRSWKNLEEMHRLRIKDRFGHLKLNQIHKGEVQKFLNELKDSGLSAATCDHHGKLIRQLLNVAVDWGYLDVNLVSGIRLFHEQNFMETYLEGDDLQRLLNVLSTDKNRMVCNVILFLLSTGARKDEALRAEWKDIDRKNRRWLVTAEVSKSRKRRTIQLNDISLKVLDSLGTEGQSEYLFVSSRTGGRLTEISKVWDRIRRKAEMPELRIHDLRHSYASFLANAGCNEFQIMQALGHASSGTTKRYIHLSNEAMQKAAGVASDRITEALQHDPA